jgi:Fe-S-cluster containining protein
VRAALTRRQRTREALVGPQSRRYTSLPMTTNVDPLPAVPRETIEWVDKLHAVADELAAPVAAMHGERLRCRAGCSDCCTDGLTVFSIEAALIVERHADLLATATPHPEGACAFLDDERRCRIYAERPYVCRTQGLPLRWLDEDEDEDGPFIAETRDVCPLNEAGGPPLETLEPDAFFTLGPIEERLAARQATIDDGRGVRVPLRSLFHGSRKHLPIVR